MAGNYKVIVATAGVDRNGNKWTPDVMRAAASQSKNLEYDEKTQTLYMVISECEYAKKYQGLRQPKCNCTQCWMKYYDRHL